MQQGSFRQVITQQPQMQNLRYSNAQQIHGQVHMQQEPQQFVHPQSQQPQLHQSQVIYTQQQQQQQPPPVQYVQAPQPVQYTAEHSHSGAHSHPVDRTSPAKSAGRIVELADNSRKHTDGTVGLVMVDGVSPGRIGVLTLVNNGPAEMDGTIKVGDLICSVDGVSVSRWGLEDVRKIILGPAGTNCTMVFDRPSTGEAYSVTLTRVSAAQLESNSRALLERVKNAEVIVIKERELRLHAEQENSILRQQVQALNEELDRVLSESQRREHEYTDSQTVISRLERELLVIKEEYHERSNSHNSAAFAQQTNALHQELQAERAEKQNFQSKVRLLEDKIRQIDDESSRLRRRNDELENKILALQREGDNASELALDLKRERAARAEKDSIIKDLRQQINELEIKVRELTYQLEEERRYIEQEDRRKEQEVKATLC